MLTIPIKKFKIKNRKNVANSLLTNFFSNNIIIYYFTSTTRVM